MVSKLTNKISFYLILIIISFVFNIFLQGNAEAKGEDEGKGKAIAKEDAAAKKNEESFGAIEILICNAGIAGSNEKIAILIK